MIALGTIPNIFQSRRDADRNLTDDEASQKMNYFLFSYTTTFAMQRVTGVMLTRT